MATESEVRITVSLPGDPDRELRLAYPLDPGHAELLWEIHDHHGGRRVLECRMHDHDPELAHLRGPDGRVRGVWLLVCQHPVDPARLYLRHWPNSPAGPGSHAVPRPMTEEHVRGQEYIAERGRDFGYGVVCNQAFSTANRCRADVRVAGSAAVMAAEIQVSGVETASVLHRARQARVAGAESVWFPRTAVPPPWQFRVPCVSTNQILGLEPRSWTVTTGPRALEDERCAPWSRFVVCPVQGRGHCYRHHPLWVPVALVSGRGITVDDVVELVPDGGLVRVDTGTSQGVVLATPADRDRWWDFRADGPGRPVSAPQARPVGRLRHSPYPAGRLRRRLERDGEAREVGQCSAWCRCGRTHWRREADGMHRLRTGVGECSHPGHGAPGVVWWGVSATSPEPDGRGWFWCVVSGGELADHGWAGSASEAVREAVAAVPVEVVGRCDLVAADWLRLHGRWGCGG